MRGPKFLRLWCARPQLDEVNAARAEADNLLATLLAHRARNHFSDRIAAAYRQEPR